MTQVKQCCKCGTLKPIEDFSKSYKHTCKECVAAMARESRAHKKEIKNMIEEIYPLLPTPDLSYKLPPIDWEQRRYEIAKDAMQAFIMHRGGSDNAYLDAENSVFLADTLINHLKNTPAK